jgi:hypothetical protein
VLRRPVEPAVLFRTVHHSTATVFGRMPVKTEVREVRSRPELPSTITSRSSFAGSPINAMCRCARSDLCSRRERHTVAEVVCLYGSSALDRLMVPLRAFIAKVLVNRRSAEKGHTSLNLLNLRAWLA